MNKHKKFNSILYRIVFLALMLVLISTHLSMGIAAKFLSSATGSDSGRVARFSCSTNIDNYSALTFTNTAFWGGSSDSGVAMNALRSVTFSVHNWDYAEGSNTEKVVNEVASSYELNFSAPANFVEKLAIQLFDSADHPLMPQFAIHDLIESFHDTNVGDSTSDTANYKTTATAKYNGKHFGLNDITFAATKNGDNYTAVATDSNPNDGIDENIVVSLTKFSKIVDQTLYFRLWDVSHVTNQTTPYVENELGKLLAPLQLVTTRSVDFYKISISLPSRFILPVNVAKTDSYLLRIAPTHAIFDDHLGMVIPSSTASSSFEYNNIQDIETNTEYFAASWMEEITDVDGGHVVSHNKEAVINPIIPSDGESTNTSTITEALTEATILHDVKKDGESTVNNVVIPAGSTIDTTVTEVEKITNTTKVNVQDKTDDTYLKYTQTVETKTTKVYEVTTNGEKTTYTHNSTTTVTRTIIYEMHNNINFKVSKILVPTTDSDGKVTYDDTKTTFSLFETVDGINKQKYFISECYSKNYPMSVSVTFTQID